VSGVSSVNRRAGGPKCMHRAPAYSYMRVYRDPPGMGAFDPATTVSLLHCGGWGACLFSRSSDKGEGVSNGNRPVGPPAARTAARTGQVARGLRRSRVCSLSAARRRLRPGPGRARARSPVPGSALARRLTRALDQAANGKIS
jgi:hypothetical protein